MPSDRRAIGLAPIWDRTALEAPGEDNLRANSSGRREEAGHPKRKTLSDSNSRLFAFPPDTQRLDVFLIDDAIPGLPLTTLGRTRSNFMLKFGRVIFIGAGFMN
jgi:hypothetical protein